jgi:iron uptake system EfeUOB component EfeO/EfeM
MLNPELKKELMLKLQVVIKEIETECENDSEFYDHLEQVDILQPIEELQSINGINKLIEKYDKAINAKSNEKYKKYNEVIKALMDFDRYARYDEILDDQDNNLDSAINTLIEALKETIECEQYEEGELPFYQEQLNLINELI